MLSRRKFLVGASGSVLVAAFGRSNPAQVLGERPPSGPIRQQQSGGPFQVFAPGIGNDGFYPDVRVSMFNPFQGGALLVSATNALAGTARVFGRDYTLAPGPEGVAGFVGFGTEDPPGYANLTVHLTDTTNQPLNY